MPSHDAITHPRFVNINTQGKYTSRADYLKYWATAFDPAVTVYWDLRDERIDMFGDVALVRAANKHVTRATGQDGKTDDVTGMTMYTDIYLREGGRWLCIQAQLTTIAPEHWPPDTTIRRRYVSGILQPEV